MSESRLLRSPLSGLANFAQSLSFEGNKPSSAAKRYPLCVVSPQDRDGRHITWNAGGSNDEKYDDKFEYEGGHGHDHDGVHDDDDDDTDKDKDDKAGRPVVNCIVVVKGDKDKDRDSNHHVVPGPKPGPPIGPQPGPPNYSSDYPLELWKWYQQFGRWLSQFPCDPKVQRCP